MNSSRNSYSVPYTVRTIGGDRFNMSGPHFRSTASVDQSETRKCTTPIISGLNLLAKLCVAVFSIQNCLNNGPLESRLLLFEPGNGLITIWPIRLLI